MSDTESTSTTSPKPRKPRRAPRKNNVKSASPAKSPSKQLPIPKLTRQPRQRKPENVKREAVKDIRALLKLSYDSPETIPEEKLAGIRQQLIECYQNHAPE
jgi:hypothetical protein